MRPAASGRDRTQYSRTGNNQKLLCQPVHPVQQRGALLVAHVLRHRKSRMLLAAAELGRRITAARAAETDVISSSDDVVRLFRSQLETLSHEECWAVYLTSSNRIIERQRVSQGGVQGTVVDHRLIIKRALELLATQLILIHNHPSGAAEASPQDKVLTERIAQAAALFDIRLLDHIIIAREGDFSFLREGLIS